MQKTNKFIVSLILVTTISSITLTTQAFTDIKDSEQKIAIDYLEAKGVIDGYADGTFKPNNLINRAELAKILVEAADYNPDVDQYHSCFPDVKKEWFARYICFAKEKGWVQGYPNNTFKPAQNVNRAEAMKMLLNSRKIEVPANVNTNIFKDVKVGEWYAPYVKVAKDQKVTLAQNFFYPESSITRGEFSLFAYRSMINDEETNDDDNNPQFASELIVWANEGGDKVTQDELRADKNATAVKNSVWDGAGINIFAAKNEVVNFNLIIEAPDQKLSNLAVKFDTLTGPNSAKIETSSSEFFDWTEKNIELFYVKYLEIKGLSAFMGDNYDQRHLPKKLRTPHDSEGRPLSDSQDNILVGWTDRPNHNKFYPEIAVPLELEQGFDIAANKNQSIWVDIYIPKNKPAGTYNGTIEISQNNKVVSTIPVELKVYDFTLPDMPNSKTMLSLGYGDINQRYMGEKWPNDTDSLAKIKEIRDEHFKLAHRHKISLVDNDSLNDKPADQWLDRLSGDLFTAANGYDGPGINVGNNVFSIGHYGSWGWQEEGEAGMQKNTDSWEKWFQDNSPTTERFLYLIDESSDYEQIEQWAKWIEKSPGPGKNLMSFATIWAPSAYKNTPSLDIATSGMYVGDTIPTQKAVDYFNNKSDKRMYMYNGGRPGQGSFMTDDDGIALRELAWGQYKKSIDRWFYWESTYYNNFQAGRGESNVFTTAHTFGGNDGSDKLKGESGWNYSNGDGVLFYPGTDKVFPAESYEIDGPIASLRLKYWRRGIQDVDYLTLAAQKDPQAVARIITEIVPKVLWEYGVNYANDPTWVRSEISWSDDPDVWENARKELAEIIE
ncbi:MAG: glycoside hydrolase domain-containing protein [Patescibacteria group bacterium]